MSEKLKDSPDLMTRSDMGRTMQKSNSPVRGGANDRLELGKDNVLDRYKEFLHQEKGYTEGAEPQEKMKPF